MGTRAELQGELLKLAPYAYYQPPVSLKINYPCFIYQLSPPKTEHADNRIYIKIPHYTLTYISSAVSDHKVDEILCHFKYCHFDRSFTADGLHHYTFDLFY